MTATRSAESRWANHSAVMIEVADALDAWCPPTFTPSVGHSNTAIALKQGRLGSRLIHSDFSTQVPALRVEAVDTTGAGDAFAAGLIHALAHHLDDHAALVLANTLGALATTRIGAGTALPHCAEITEALRSGWNENPTLAAAAQRAGASLDCSQGA